MLFNALSTALAASAALASYAPQMSLEFPAPEQDLHSLASDAFTTLSHPSYPAHSVRIKRLDDLCDNNSTSVGRFRS